MLVEIIAYFLASTGSPVGWEKILLVISFLLVPTIIVVFDIRKGRFLYHAAS